MEDKKQLKQEKLMKRFIVLLLLIIFGLAACGGSNIEDDIVGKWVASGTEEAFNTYEFFADGTGFLSTPNGSLSVDITYEFTDGTTMLFSVDGNDAVTVNVSMPDENRLTFELEGADVVINLRRVEE